MNLSQRAARGGAITILGQLVRLIIQLSSVMVLARLISQTDFGLYAMAFAILGIAQVLGDFGLSMAAVQSQRISKSQKSNLFWTNALLGAICLLTAYICAPFISQLFDEPALIPVIRVLAVTFLLHSLAAQFRAELMTQLRFGMLSLVDIISALTGLIVALCLAMNNAGIWSLVAQTVTISASTLVILVFSAKWLPTLPTVKAPMKDLYRFGANTLGVQVFIYLTSNIDSILIGRFSGATALGYYDRAYRIFRMPMQQIASPLTKVGVPILSKLQDEPISFSKYVHRGQLVLGYLFGGAFFVIAACSDPIVEIMLGEGWDLAKPILAVLSIGGVFQAMTYVYSWVFLSKALTKLQLKWTILGRSVMVILMAIGVTWGPIGVASFSALGLAVNWIILTFFPIKKSGLPSKSLIKTALKPAAIYTPIALITYIISHLFLHNSNPWLHLVVLLLVFTSLLLFSLLAPPIRKDFVFLFDTARNTLSRRRK